MPLPSASEAAASAPSAADVDLLRTMVAIPSLSDHEGPAVSELCRQMEARGLRIRIDDAGNAIGSIGSGSNESSFSAISTRCLARYRFASRMANCGDGAQSTPRVHSVPLLPRRRRRRRTCKLRSLSWVPLVKNVLVRLAQRSCDLGGSRLLHRRGAEWLGCDLPRLSRHPRISLPPATTFPALGRARGVRRRTGNRLLERPGCHTGGVERCCRVQECLYDHRTIAAGDSHH